MASYGAVEAGEGMGSGRAVSQDDSEVSLRLADALRKMDGLIGDYRYIYIRPLSLLSAARDLIN